MNLNSCKVVLALFLLAVAQQAWAQDTDVGTNAGETITSSATVDYKVNNVDQTQAAATGGTLIVDRKVDLLVTSLGTASTTATPGATTNFAGGLTAIPFTVYNGTNATMDLVLEADTTSVDPWGGTVSGAHPPSTFYLFLDDGTTGGELDAGDTPITPDGGGIYFLDEVPEGHTTNVLVAAAIPAAAVNGEILPISLQATAYDGGAVGLGDLSEETSGGDTAAEDTVFADADGLLDGPRDGKHSASDSYKVESAAITVTKTSWVIDDPINDTTDPKAIPGATIRYCITVANGGSTAADNVLIKDLIDVARVTYNPGTLYVGEDLDCSGSSPPTSTAAGLLADETAGVATASNGATGDYGVTAGNQVTTNLGSIAGSAKKTTIFDVTIKSN